MKIKIVLSRFVGGAFDVVSVSRFGAIKTLAIGLTEFEAVCFKKRLTIH